MRKNDLLEFHAEFCKTFSNPIRLEIFDMLKDGEMCVTTITKRLGATKANVSQHLRLMKIKGVLKTRRDGTNIYYSLANRKLAQACSLMQDALLQLM